MQDNRTGKFIFRSLSPSSTMKNWDASFTKAVSNGGSDLLWSHTSRQRDLPCDTHSRESVRLRAMAEGCSHEGLYRRRVCGERGCDFGYRWYVQDYGARQVGGQSIQGGESHRISKGVYICSSRHPSIGIRTWKTTVPLSRGAGPLILVILACHK